MSVILPLVTNFILCSRIKTAKYSIASVLFHRLSTSPFQFGLKAFNVDDKSSLNVSKLVT